MRFPLLFRIVVLCSCGAFICADGKAQNVAVGDAEVQKCEDRIASVQRELMNRYDDALQELQLNFQKAADLEGALAVRAERQRASKEGVLTEKNLVGEPKSLRTAQTQTLSKMQELISQVVQETVPKLIELKKSLTIAGKLDDAVSVRTAIERLQNTHVPITRPDAGTAVSAETLLQAYAADRSRADKTYKGQRILVRGVVGGYRQDPADAKQYLVYLTGSGANGWIQSAFSTTEFRIREEKQFSGTSLVITPKDNDSATVRVQKGQTMELRGVCEGWDEVVKLMKCDLSR